MIDFNLDEKMKSFDFSVLFSDTTESAPVKIEANNKIELTGSALALQTSKRSKEADNRYNNKVKGSYACRYEKALITIAEKNNGEI